jgi:hypothetical protein
MAGLDPAIHAAQQRKDRDAFGGEHNHLKWRYF